MDEITSCLTFFKFKFENESDYINYKFLNIEDVIEFCEKLTTETLIEFTYDLLLDKTDNGVKARIFKPESSKLYLSTDTWNFSDSKGNLGVTIGTLAESIGRPIVHSVLTCYLEITSHGKTFNIIIWNIGWGYCNGPSCKRIMKNPEEYTEEQRRLKKLGDGEVVEAKQTSKDLDSYDRQIARLHTSFPSFTFSALTLRHKTSLYQERMRAIANAAGATTKSQLKEPRNL